MVGARGPSANGVFSAKASICLWAVTASTKFCAVKASHFFHNKDEHHFCPVVSRVFCLLLQRRVSYLTTGGQRESGAWSIRPPYQGSEHAHPVRIGGTVAHGWMEY